MSRCYLLDVVPSPSVLETDGCAPCCAQGCRIYLVGTKLDVIQKQGRTARQVDFHDAVDYADSVRAVCVLETSSLTGYNVGQCHISTYCPTVQKRHPPSPVIMLVSVTYPLAILQFGRDVFTHRL